MNELRVPFIAEALKECNVSQDQGPSGLLKGLKIIDVGCGGGLLTEVCFIFHTEVLSTIIQLLSLTFMIKID